MDRAIERQRGVEFQIPIFDFGETRMREAEQTYMAAVTLSMQQLDAAFPDGGGF